MYRQPKVTLLLVLLLMMILGGLGWLTYQMQKNDAIVVAHQQQSFIESQIQTAETTITAYIQQMEVQLLADAQRFNFHSEEGQHYLRDYLRRSPLVNFIYSADPEGKRAFPRQGAESNHERVFLRQTRELWLDDELFVAKQAEVLEYSPKASRYSLARVNSRQQNTVTSSDRKFDSGWLNWYGADRQAHLFWLKDGDGRLIAFDFLLPRLVSDIINRLPDDRDVSALLGRGSMRLVDDRNTTLYQWGRYRIVDGTASAGYRYLPQPFRNWKLEYYHQDDIRSGAWLQRLLTFGGFSLALILLFIYLYKEQTRAIADASQRVSFVNQVSHELKTPLTNVRMYAELLEGELSSDEQKSHKYLAVIIGESVRLGRLIENVLNFSRIQKDKITINRKPGVIDHCVKRCLETFAESLKKNDLTVTFIAEAQQEVAFDQDLLEQILNNLLSNAEKYAFDGKKIEVHTQLNAGRARIAVRDFGKGIPKNERSRVFEPFYRVSSKLTEGVSGTGIGLSIARSLARQHGGNISILDQDPGCCFIVELDVSTVYNEALNR